MRDLRERIGDALATGRLDSAVARALAAAWGSVAGRSLVRPGRVPSGVRVVCVGGATLGGSGKTRLALACARWLAARGRRVVLLGHAYPAKPRRGRTVRDDDPIEHVGDEALACARALGPSAKVVVGPTRQTAIDHALTLGPDVLVCDGPLRLREAECLSLLAVDAREPWGQGTVPPVGDLRAPRRLLEATADHVVPVEATPTAAIWNGEKVALGSLSGARLGLFTAVARPHRLRHALEAEGLRFEEVVAVGDHGPLPAWAARRLAERGELIWLATEKCRVHMGATPRRAILSSELALSPAAERVLSAFIGTADADS